MAQLQASNRERSLMQDLLHFAEQSLVVYADVPVLALRGSCFKEV